jgi:RimJ/RimL family protein N-acetyltransferase
MILFSSDRLDFYKMTTGHFEEFCEMDMDSKVMEFYTSRAHGTRENALASFKRYEEYQALFPELGGFMVYSKGTQEFVGLGVLIHLELNPKSLGYEVGYRLPVRSWGKGFATEICQRLIQYGFETLGFSEIFGTTHPDHVVSQKILMKCGLEKLGASSNYGGSTIFNLKRP